MAIRPGGGGSGSGASSLAPTATLTAPYTAAAGDLALMNVAGGATTLTLPSAPADKAQVAYRAIGATVSVPLKIVAGGSDTIGTTGATSATVPLADEVAVLQYQAATGRWLAVSNVKTQASLDARYAPLLPRTGERQLIRSYNIVDGPATTNTYSFPNRLRPYEAARRQVRVRNIGTTAIQVAYGTTNNSDFNTPASGQWTANPTIQPGEEWIDNYTAAGLFVRPNTSGQGYRVGIYAEIGVL